MNSGEQVTVRDVARRAGVSTGTVSRVLNGHDNVAAQLRDRVEAALVALDYRSRPSRSRRPPPEDIGFLLVLPHADREGELMSSFWAEILHGAEAEATSAGARVHYRSVRIAGLKNAEVSAELSGLRLDATLLVGEAPAAVVEPLRRTGIPVVLVDSVSPDGRSDAVISDWFSGAQAVVSQLIEVGHRHIGFIGGPLSPGSATRNAVYSIEQRALGYRDALFHAGLIPQPGWAEPSRLTPNSGYQACRRLLERVPELTAIFCANDPTATGVLRALSDLGLPVPERMSLVGFDDDLASRHTNPLLTTVRVQKEAMGRVAVRTLLLRSAKPDGPIGTLVLPVEVVNRHSVGPPRR